MANAHGYNIMAIKDGRIRVFYAPFGSKLFLDGHEIKRVLEYKGWTVFMYPGETVRSIEELYGTLEEY